jgi:AcrR family transcriptional regulator
MRYKLVSTYLSHFIQEINDLNGICFNPEHHGRMSRDERREQILQTAFDMFSRHGFAGTTTRDIAQAAGVSEATLFKHFATKEELYGAIIDAKRCEKGLSEYPWLDNKRLMEARESGDDREFFYQFALQAMENHQKNVAFMRMIFYSALEEHELAERFFGDFVSEIYAFLSDYIRRRQRDGAFRKFNPKIAVRAFLGMLIHHSLNNILWDKNRRILNISNEKAARSFTDIMLHGLYVKNGD